MSNMISFRCPELVSLEIEKRQKESGKSKTEVVLDLINGLPSIKVEDRKKLPSVSAVYIVWTSEKILYIGQTENLTKRFKKHHRLVEFLNDDAFVAWFDAEACDRLEIESGLTKLFLPELDKAPASFDNLNRKGYMGTPPAIKKTTVAIVIDEPMLAEIDRTAVAKGISRSAEIRHRLEQYEKSWKDSEENPSNYSEY